MSEDLKQRTCLSDILGFFARLFNTSWPLFVTHNRIVSFQGVRLLVFAFSDNLSAENYKLSAESGLPGLSFLECMSTPCQRKVSPKEFPLKVKSWGTYYAILTY